MSETLPTRADPPPNPDGEEKLSGCFEHTIFIIIIIIIVGIGVIFISLVFAFSVLIFYLLTSFGVASSVLLLICLLVTRIFQLIRSDDEYQTLSFYKNLIRTWLYIIPVLSLWGLWLFYPLAKYVPSLKQVTLAEVPLTRWIKVISIMCGLSCFSFFPYIVVMQSFHKSVKNGSTNNVGQAIVEIFDSLIFWWATNVLMKHVPSIKHQEILGLPTRTWIWVSVVLLIGYNILVLFIRLIVLLLQVIVSLLITSKGSSSWKNFLKKHFHVNYAVYVANGMKVSVCFVLSSLSLLLTWNFYFGSHLDLNSPSVKRVWEDGRWSFISLLTFSVLWLIKTFVLLVWDAHTVYNRLRRQIFSASKQLYFLGILGSLEYNFFKLQLHPEDIDEGKEKNLTDFFLSFLHSSAGLIANSQGSPTISSYLIPWTFLSSLHLSGGLKANSRNSPTILSNLMPWIDYHIPLKVSKYFNLLCKVRENIQDDLLKQQQHDQNSTDPTLDDIHRATQYFFQAQQSLAEESYIDHIMQNFHSNGIKSLKWKKLILGEIVNNNNSDETHKRSSTEEEGVQSGQVTVAQNSNQNAQGENEEIEEDFPVAEISNGENPNPNQVQERQRREQNNCTSDRHWSEDLTSFRNLFNDIEKEISQFGKTKQENLDPDLPYSISDIQTWVEGAHKHCVKMVNTLSSAKELADCLNKIMSWVLIGAIFIMWLLLTGLATTKVLVLIASPLVAASFIFGETCKTLFQGIIYVYVVHPLYVGDLCAVDNKMDYL